MKPRFINSSLTALEVGVAALSLILAARGDVFDNFDSGTDNGWSHLEPLAAFGAPGIFTFPNGGYRIQATTSPDPANLGAGRAGSLRLDQNLAGFGEGCD